MADRSESSLEDSFVTLAAKNYFLCLKIIAVGNYGFPDRLIFGLNRHIFFVELKKSDKKPMPRQAWWHRRLRKMGFNCYVCDNIEVAEEIFKNEQRLQNENKKA